MIELTYNGIKAQSYGMGVGCHTLSVDTDTVNQKFNAGSKTE